MNIITDIIIIIIIAQKAKGTFLFVKDLCLCSCREANGLKVFQWLLSFDRNLCRWAGHCKWSANVCQPVTLCSSRLKTKLKKEPRQVPEGRALPSKAHIFVTLCCCVPSNSQYLLLYPNGPGSSLRFLCKEELTTYQFPSWARQASVRLTYLTTSDVRGEDTPLSPEGKLITLVDLVPHA